MAETIWPALVAFAEDHLLTTHNIYMVLGSYVLIWAMEPAIVGLVERLPKRRQLAVWEWQKRLKNIAAILWCEVLVWIPTVQPPLCSDEQAHGCQTVFGRLMLALLLGAGLSLLHKYLIARLKRAVGVRTKEPREVTLSR